jgi:hypothetical protein
LKLGIRVKVGTRLVYWKCIPSPLRGATRPYAPSGTATDIWVSTMAFPWAGTTFFSALKEHKSYFKQPWKPPTCKDRTQPPMQTHASAPWPFQSASWREALCRRAQAPTARSFLNPRTFFSS